MTTRSTSRLVSAGAALLLLLATLAACGADPAATPDPTPTPEPEPGPTATPEPASDGISAAGWRTDVAVGSSHGDRAANASLTLPDGSSTTLESVAAGRGVLLYFFATWWPTCRGEARTLDTLYDDYKDDVEFVFVAWSDPIGSLNDYAQSNSYDWVFAEGGPDTPRDFNIRSQATYVGIGRDGAIVASSGGGSGKNWPSILDQLSAT